MTGTFEDLPAVDEAAISELERGLPGGDLGGALATFAIELEKRGGELVRLHADRDETGLSSLAHGLKGTAATFCAPALASAARQLEDKLAARDGDEIDAAISQVSAEVRRVIDHLRGMLVRRTPQHG